MKVMMITEKDAANASLAKIADAFLKRGDCVKIYATYFDEKVLGSFDKSIEKHRAKDIKQSDIEWCDIIVCSTLVSIYVPIVVFFAHKPIFTHNYLMNRQINWGGDLCFAPTQQTVESDYDEYLNYSYMGIGEPKYDEPVTELNDKQKRMLFIDSGHYPFAYEGKQELARILVRTCLKYPDYELWIKPRFLPGDKVITHRNNIHIYDVIRKECGGDVPKNLVMLETHQDLKALINQSNTVICMYTTSFVGAVVAGKGLVLIDNLPTKDVYDIRNKTYMRNRENMLNSGALIDYREVDSLLPDGVKCSEEYLDYLLEEKENTADKIAEVCHVLWGTYYSKGFFPKYRDTTYKEYKSVFSIDDDMTWKKQTTRRCQDYFLLKSLILIDFHVNSKLDISYILKKADECLEIDGFIHEETFRGILANVNGYRDKCIIQNEEIMLKDDIDAGVLLNALYLQKEYDRIREFSNHTISAYHMYRAFTAIDTKETNAKTIAKQHLIQYFDQCIEREYNLEISDMPNNKFRAYIELLELLKEERSIPQTIYYTSHMKRFYLQNYFVNELYDNIADPLQKERCIFVKQMESWIRENE